MNLLAKISILIFFAILFFPGCKKYPEGGTSVRAKRVFYSEKQTCWDVSAYMVDGIDSTGSIVSTGNTEELKNYVCFFKYSRFPYCSQKYAGSFEIEYDKEQLEIGGKHNGAYNIPSGGRMRNVLCPGTSIMTWKIRRCKKDEIVLEGMDSGRQYRLILRR